MNVRTLVSFGNSGYTPAKSAAHIKQKQQDSKKSSNPTEKQIELTKVLPQTSEKGSVTRAP